MGIAANLFSIDDSENCLAYRVKPTKEQREEQQERWNDLRDVLIAELAGYSGYSISSWLQGSYKFGTQIRPAKSGEEFDIDLGIYFEWLGEPEDGNFSPVELKDFVQNMLVEYAADEANDSVGVSDPKTRCNRIHFSGDFHIDVPTYHLDGPRDLRALATQENKWENSDPKKIYVWWTTSLGDARRSRARRLVRYLKMWVVLNFANSDRPSSILLTVLSCEAFLTLDESQLSGDDEYLRALVEAILQRLKDSTKVLNPVDESEDINRLSAEATQNLINELDTLISTSDRALAAMTEADSADVWTEAFHHFFPIPEEESIVEGTSNNALAPLVFDPQVSVVAKFGKRQIRGVNRIGPIPRGCDLIFEIMNRHELPVGAEVIWIARNSGAEAEAQNDLGHRRQNGTSAQDRSAYKGEHHMDVTVRLNGRSIGRRRVMVQVNGLGLPYRNPAKKSWVKLRG